MSTAASLPRPDVSQSLIVEASAGTGKTRALVEQVVAMIAAGTRVDRIAAVTFTHAAAGEMKWRVRQGLESARQTETGEGARRHLTGALRHLDQAFIGTIHSFCAQLLHQRPVEACVDPNFQELDEVQAYEVFTRVFRNWVEERLSRPAPALERALVRLAWLDDEGRDPLDVLQRTAWRLIEWRDHAAPWSRRGIDRDAEIARAVDRAAAIAAMREHCLRPGQDLLYRSLQPLADLLDRIARMEAAGRRDNNLIESDLFQLPRATRWLKKGYGQFGQAVSRESLIAAWHEFELQIAETRLRLDADLAADLRDELWELVDRFQDAKRRRGALDFMDLLLQACRLLENDEARQYFQQRYERILIDEFQDTDPLQAEVLVLLGADDPAERDWRRVTPVPGKLFLVGDPKQSIYRFRRADVSLYRGVSADLGARGVKRGTLSRSLRSVTPIQEFVNAAFAPRMPEYLALTGGRPPHERQPAVVALPIPYPYGARDVTQKAILKGSPEAVAAFVEWLVRQSNWKVSDPLNPGRALPVAPEHVCILFRRFSNWGVDLTQEYVRSLEARRIAHVLVGSKSFHQREEVGTIRTALRAIEWPEDGLSVFATVRGPLFSVPDGSLLKFRAQFGPLHPFKQLPEDLDAEFAPIRDALSLLADLHRARNYRPLADTINRLLEHTRAHAGFAFRKGGGRVLANVCRLTDMARGFEARGVTSFRSFIDFLDREAEQGEAAEAPLLEQQSAGVKIMTVHRAKGLEFPVVILADLTAKLTGGEGGDRYVDSSAGLCAQRLLGCSPWELIEHRDRESAEDRAEADRIAYVAATRARDLLVVTAIGDGEFAESWLTPLYPALYPPRERYRNSTLHPGCATPGDATVLARFPEYQGEEISVRPGMHTPQAGGHEVFWFDPALLDLKGQKDEGLAFQDVLVGPPDDGLRRYGEWQQQRASMVERGAVPEYQILRAAEGGYTPGSTLEIEVVTVPRLAGGRPGGRAFGRLVHALLEQAGPPMETAARAHARAVGAAAADIPAALEVVSAALAHPLMLAASACTCCREMPLLLKLDDGALVEGRVDLAFRDESGWVVVEFKTDTADQLRYRRQLQLYAAALSQATGLPVKGVLFEV
jgi:ATP-dependent exoDNAse (exonuclease V) beta subunit